MRAVAAAATFVPRVASVKVAACEAAPFHSALAGARRVARRVQGVERGLALVVAFRTARYTSEDWGTIGPCPLDLQRHRASWRVVCRHGNGI